MSPARAVTFVLLVVVGAACSAAPETSPTPSPTPETRPLVPLPGTIDGIPGPGDQSVVLPAQSPRGVIQVGVAVGFTLGHCGLMSPIDLDGSLWDPIGGDNGSGGPLTEDQVGELINSTTVTLTLVAPGRAVLVTPRGAVVTLARHDGPRAYLLCQ